MTREKHWNNFLYAAFFEIDLERLNTCSISSCRSVKAWGVFCVFYLFLRDFRVPRGPNRIPGMWAPPKRQPQPTSPRKPQQALPRHPPPSTLPTPQPPPPRRPPPRPAPTYLRNIHHPRPLHRRHRHQYPPSFTTSPAPLSSPHHPHQHHQHHHRCPPFSTTTTAATTTITTTTTTTAANTRDNLSRPELLITLCSVDL